MCVGGLVSTLPTPLMDAEHVESTSASTRNHPVAEQTLTTLAKKKKAIFTAQIELEKTEHLEQKSVVPVAMLVHIACHK